MPQSIDKRLISAAKNGDLAAFEQLLFTFEKTIFNHIYRILGDRRDAEDLTQETFVKVYKNLKKLDPDGNFRSWLYKIATNTTYDHLRKKKKQPPVLLVGENEWPFETLEPGLTYDNTEKVADSADLGEALSKLKPIHKTVLLLFYQQDMSYEEIAQMLSLSLNTVKTHLRRAKLALKQELT